MVTVSSVTENKWTGAPNTTDLPSSMSPNWSNVTLFVPGSSSSDNRVGFLNATNSSTSVVTSGFLFYGSTAMNRHSSGLQTLWSVGYVSDGVYELFWNDTASDQVPVTLRNVAPSKPSSLR